MKKILIATCGTSVLTNARTLKEEILGDRHFSNMTEEERKIIKVKLLENLKIKNANDRSCGAEVNSTYFLLEQEKIEIEKIILIASDSVDGILAAEIIKELLSTKLNIKNIEIKKVDKLNITKEYEFAIKGLRNLIRTTTEIIKGYNIQDLIIAPIGGFKAQISMVALVAQIYKIPAYYLYENSSNIIKMLPLPISLDTEFFINNIDFITRLAKEDMIPKNEVKDILNANPELNNIIEEESLDGEKYICLSSIGILGYEKLLREAESNLPRPAKPEEKIMEITAKNDEGHSKVMVNRSDVKNIFKNILDIPYVTKIIVNYHHPRNKGDIVRVNKSGNESEGRTLKIEINRKEGILGALIFLTENEEEKVNAALVDIKDKLGI